MPVTHPLTFPRSPVAPDTDEAEAASESSHVAAGFAASGDCYVLSDFLQRSTRRKASGQAVARYRPDGTLAAHLVISLKTEEQGARTTAGLRARVSDLCVLPGGTVALSCEENRTYLLDDDLTGLTGAWDGIYEPRRGELRPHAEKHLATSFAAAVRTTPSGRLLCVVSEYGLYIGNGKPNLIGLAEEPPTPEHRPTIRVFASLHTPSAVARPNGGDTTSVPVPYTDYGGAPAGGGNHPEPGLIPSAGSRWPDVGGRMRPWAFLPHLEGYAVVADDLFVVPIFASGGPQTASSAYAYALVDDTGALVGRLAGPGTGDRSPVPGGRYAIAADPARGRVFHLNRSGLYVWSANGTLLTMLPTSEKAYRLLKHLRLMGCGPDGDVVLARPEHNLLTRVEVPEDLDRLGDAVAAALADHVRQRTRLKKQLSPSDWLWPSGDAPVIL